MYFVPVMPLLPAIIHILLSLSLSLSLSLTHSHTHIHAHTDSHTQEKVVNQDLIILELTRKLNSYNFQYQLI